MLSEQKLLELDEDFDKDILMDALEVDTANRADYQDNLNLWTARVTRLTEREETAAGQQSPLLEWCEAIVITIVLQDKFGRKYHNQKPLE